MPKSHKRITIKTFPLELVATCLYLSLSKVTRSLSTVIAEDVKKDTAQSTNVIKSMSHVCNEKYRIFCPSRTSNRQYTWAPQEYQHRDPLSLGYDTGIWKQKADEVKILCVAQPESEYSPKNAPIDRNIFTTARKINWPYSFTENTSKQNCSKLAFWCSSPVKLVSVAMSVQCQKERKALCLVYQYIYDPMTLWFLSRYSRGLESFFFFVDQQINYGRQFPLQQIPCFYNVFLFWFVSFTHYIFCAFQIGSKS